MAEVTQPGLAGRDIAAALLHTADGRYLMQHRDPFPDISFPDYWSCFGGGIEPGESGTDALCRELREEISYAPRRLELFTEIAVLLPPDKTRRDRLYFFAVPIGAEEVGGMRLREGAGLALWRPDELVHEPKVIPWDLAAVLMHAHRDLMFPRR